MSKLLVFHHLGLGDHLVMNGFVHLLLQQSTEILLVCKKHNKKSVEKMYQGYPVELYLVDKAEDMHPENDPLRIIKDFINKGYKYIGFGQHGLNQNYLSLDISWANCFYMQYNINPIVRWNNFKFPSDLNKSKSLANSVYNVVGNRYIIVHDDPSRGFSLVHDKVRKSLKEDGFENVPVIYFGKSRYERPLIDGCNNPDLSKVLETETLYDYCHLLANAEACHMMDSSVALLLDLLTVREDQKRYMHEYAKAGEILSTEGLFQKVWSRIY
jgi:hypothetical protein